MFLYYIILYRIGVMFYGDVYLRFTSVSTIFCNIPIYFLIGYGSFLICILYTNFDTVTYYASINLRYLPSLLVSMI